VLITCGAFTPKGDFLELPQFDMDRLLAAWQDAVFELYLAEEKIEPEVVENMRTWEHSGWYSNKSRGMRKKAEAAVSKEPLAEEATTSRSIQAWAMLIKRVYEVDPLCCPGRPARGTDVRRLPLELALSATRISSGTGNQISYQSVSVSLAFYDVR